MLILCPAATSSTCKDGHSTEGMALPVTGALSRPTAGRSQVRCPGAPTADPARCRRPPPTVQRSAGAAAGRPCGTTPGSGARRGRCDYLVEHPSILGPDVRQGSGRCAATRSPAPQPRERSRPPSAGPWAISWCPQDELRCDPRELGLRWHLTRYALCAAARLRAAPSSTTTPVAMSLITLRCRWSGPARSPGLSVRTAGTHTPAGQPLRQFSRSRTAARLPDSWA